MYVFVVYLYTYRGKINIAKKYLVYFNVSNLKGKKTS